jgi:hypothetical protein
MVQIDPSVAAEVIDVPATAYAPLKEGDVLQPPIRFRAGTTARPSRRS